MIPEDPQGQPDSLSADRPTMARSVAPTNLYTPEQDDGAGTELAQGLGQALIGTGAITGEQLTTAFFPLLEVEPPRLSQDRYDVADFLSRVVAPHDELRSVGVAKHRSIYDAGLCTAEISTG